MPSTDTRTQHTPGPWHDTGLPQEHAIAIAADGPVHICRITRASMNAQANARLIAAAPDLLAALEDVQRGIEVGTERGIEESIDWEHYLTIIRTAICKARGEE